MCPKNDYKIGTIGSQVYNSQMKMVRGSMERALEKDLAQPKGGTMTSPLDEAVERVPTLAQSMAEIADRDDTTGLAADALREGSELLRTILNALSPDEERRDD